MDKIICLTLYAEEIEKGKLERGAKGKICTDKYVEDIIDRVITTIRDAVDSEKVEYVKIKVEVITKDRFKVMKYE